MLLRPGTTWPQPAWLALDNTPSQHMFEVSVFRQNSNNTDMPKHLAFQSRAFRLKIPFVLFPNGPPPTAGGQESHGFSPNDVTHVRFGDRAQKQELLLQLHHEQPDPHVHSTLLGVTAFVNGLFCAQDFVDLPELFPLPARPPVPSFLTAAAAPYLHVWI